MKQKDIAKWMKGICILLAIMGGVFFGWIVPKLVGAIRSLDIHLLYWPILIYIWGIGIACYVILYYFWRVCNEVQKDNSFSKENAKAFVTISHITLGMAIYLFFGLIFTVCVGQNYSVMLVMLICAILISIIISILAACLSHLIRKAYEMREENELTI